MTDCASPTAGAFLADFAAMSRFGATEGGGVERQAASVADGEQRRWLSDWLETRGFETGYDGIGNQYGLLTLNPGAAYVLTGSHMDSQPRAGRYDGAYGVLASAHAAVRAAERWSRAAELPTFNVAVVNWFNEEGSRFTPSMMGSSVFTGKLDVDRALAATDPDGVTVEEALAAIGTVGAFEMPVVAGYAEIHVEQGRILEDTRTSIGLVSGTWGARKFAFSVLGEQAHTGSAVMGDRRDALLGASLLVVLARDLADEFAAAPLHTSVSRIVVEPNSPVVIAREATFNLDLRSPDEGVLAEAERMLQARIADIERRAQVRVTWTRTHSWGQLAFPQEGVALGRKAAEHLGLSNREVLTVAGHDSVNMKDVVPTVMLFVPSVDGISHNEREHTADEYAVAGVDVLTETLFRMMDGALR